MKNRRQWRIPVLLLCLCLGADLSPAFGQKERPDKVILLGEVLQSASWNDDLGTFSGHCLLRVDSVFRDGVMVYKGQTLSLQVERSFSEDVPGQEAFQRDWLNLRGTRVFLFAEHLDGQLSWPREIVLIPFAELPADQHPTSSIQRIHMQQVLYGPPASTHSKACPLCAAFAEGKDDRVPKLIEKEIRKRGRKRKASPAGLQVHPCVTWEITPEAVNASLPAFATTLVVLDNGTRRRELFYTFQLGSGRRLFGLIREKVNTCKLIKVQFHDSLISSWLSTQRFALRYSLQDFDTLAYPTMPVPDEWLLLRDRYDRPDHHFYNMHPTQQYLWEQSLLGLEVSGAVFNLCLLTGHIDPQVRLDALKTLERMHDLRAVPYLLAALKFEIEFDWEMLDEAQRNEKVQFRQQLLSTLSALLGTSVETTSKELIDPNTLEMYRSFFASRVIGGELRSF